MTVDELNDFIDFVAENYNTITITGNANEYSVCADYGSSIIPNAVGMAWLAAAGIARDEGYEWAATMVELSVYNVNLEESIVYGNGPLTLAVKATDAYQDYLDYLLNCGKTSTNDSFCITKSDDADLFYALHNVTTSATGSFIGTSYASYMVTLTDVFDFEYDNDYDDLFTSLVNNWAWLCQQTHVLYPITITLSTLEP